MFAGMTAIGRERVAERVGDPERRREVLRAPGRSRRACQTPNHSWPSAGAAPGREVLRGRRWSSTSGGFSSRESWIWYFRPPDARGTVPSVLGLSCRRYASFLLQPVANRAASEGHEERGRIGDRACAAANPNRPAMVAARPGRGPPRGSPAGGAASRRSWRRNQARPATISRIRSLGRRAASRSVNSTRVVRPAAGEAPNSPRWRMRLNLPPRPCWTMRSGGSTSVSVKSAQPKRVSGASTRKRAPAPGPADLLSRQVPVLRKWSVNSGWLATSSR